MTFLFIIDFENCFSLLILKIALAQLILWGSDQIMQNEIFIVDLLIWSNSDNFLLMWKNLALLLAARVLNFFFNQHCHPVCRAVDASLYLLLFGFVQYIHIFIISFIFNNYYSQITGLI